MFETMVSFTAVRTTGIYCRPGCSARPLEANTLQFDLAAAAEAEGFRACLLCRPYRSAAPAFLAGPDIVCRAVGMILDGYLDTNTEAAMAIHLGVSSRHLRRLFWDHLGVTPNGLARSSRAHFARRLLDDTDLAIAEIAFAAGFGSVRQMNRVFKEIFRSNPTGLRAKRRKADRLVADGGLPLRLPFEGPFDWGAMISYFKQWAIPGVEHVTENRYVRTILIEGDPGVLEIEPLDDGHLVVVAHLPHWEGLIHITRRATAMLGLSSSSDQARAHLTCAPVVAPLVRQRPGVRVPGVWDGHEAGVLAILGQEMAPAEVRGVTGRLARSNGRPVPGLRQLGLTHTFPEPGQLAESDLGYLDISEALRNSVKGFSRAVADGDVALDRTRDLDDLVESLLHVPAMTVSAAHHIAFRLGYQDAFPERHWGLTDLMAELESEAPEALSEQWRPWRALAAAHLITGRDARRVD